MGLFLNDKKKSHCEKLLYHSAKGRHAQHAEDAHDAPGQQHTAHAGQHALLKAHIQQRGRQSSRPRTGAGQGDPHEQQKSPEQAPAGLRLKLLAAPLTLFQTEGEEPSNDRLILAPKKDLPGEEIDKRHRQHIPHDGDEIRQPQRHPVGHAVGDGAPQLDEGDHGYQKNDESVFHMLPHKIAGPIDRQRNFMIEYYTIVCPV